MRSMIVLVVLGVTACAQMSAPRTEESMALAQTKFTAWQDEDGKVLSAVQVQEAYPGMPEPHAHPIPEQSMAASHFDRAARISFSNAP